MPTVPLPNDFKSLLPPAQKPEEPYTGPVYWLWTFDPTTAKVVVIHNDDAHPAHHKTHHDIAADEKIDHPEKVEGYAYKIRGGYRITDNEHRPVDDPYITSKVLSLLRGHEPKKPLPHIPYHTEDNRVHASHPDV